MTGLGRRSIAAVLWGAGGAVVRVLMQLIAQVSLARLLGPAEFGVFALAALVVGLGTFLADMGIAYGLIQKHQVVEEDLRFVVTWQWVLGSTVAASIALLAPWLADFFNEARSAEVIRWMALACLLSALAAPAVNLLKRELDFKTQQLAYLASYAAGYLLVGVPLALVGAEVWALVAAWLIQSALFLVIVYAKVRHPLRPLLWFSGAKSHFQYGATVLSTNLLNWSMNNLDRVLIGRYLGSRDVGLYATMQGLLMNTTSSLVGVIQPVFFSASAKLGRSPEELDKLRAGLAALLAAVTVCLLPAFWALALVADPLVLTLYGSQWAAAAEVFRPLALAMPFFLVWALCTPLLWTQDRASREFRLQLPLGLAWLLVCGLLLSHGVVAVAWGCLAMFALRCALVLRMTLRALAADASLLWTAVRGGLLLTAALLAVLALAASWMPAWSPWLQLLCLAGIGGVTWTLIVVGVPFCISAELANLIERMLSVNALREHTQVRRWLQRRLQA